MRAAVHGSMGLAWQSHEGVPGAARLKLENLHTMTLFYLAQVYAVHPFHSLNV